MKRMAMALVLACAGCTPGATGIAGGGPGTPPQAVVIDVNLTLHAQSQSPAGTSGGYAPAITNVAVGSAVVFKNSDGFAHTATAIPGATTFPAGTPFSTAAQTQSGNAISQSWSSGVLQAGQTSQIISIDRAGTYLYGCFFHYGGPMRGTIVAR